jgi:quinol-cytochrome oxidoreductase complex cytochrome b subunit
VQATIVKATAVSDARHEPDEDAGNWTYAIRRWLERQLPLDSLLPHRMPYYVGSWVYVFGVVAIAGLIWVVASGVVLAFFGPQWWHISGVGRFVNSLHFWSVQIFFAFTVLHLWGQYFMASWREGRAPTWMVGVVIFAISIVTAFTGYVSQQNFDAQWIAVNAKDATNAAGIGAFFNVLNFGQMYGLHVMLFPVLVITLVAVHIVLVRMRGVVKPIDPAGPGAGREDSAR